MVTKPAPFLTVRDKAQLGRAIVLLQRYHDRRCAAEQIDPEHDDYDGDPAWHAKVAEGRISELLDDDSVARRRAESHAESEAIDEAIESGEVFEGLRRSVERLKGYSRRGR